MSAPRVRPRVPEEVSGTTSAIFEAYLEERGNVPNMFRTVAVRPRHLETMIAHFRVVMSEGEVPPLLKELIAIRVSSINRCRY